MSKPAVDIGLCTLCMGCVEVAPGVFALNDSGFIQVAELETYPREEIDEAIKYCPEDAITWED